MIENKLFLYDTKLKIISPASPSDVFRIKKLNTLINKDGDEDHNAVEDVFGIFENTGCSAIKKLLAGQAITVDDKRDIASLWSLQLLRTPRARTGFEVMMKEVYRSTAKLLDKQGKFGELPEALRKYGSSMTELIDNKAINISIAKEFTTLQSINAWAPLAKLLGAMNWCLLHSENDNYFMCADHPCAILDPDFDKHNMGIGIIRPNVEVTLPISKNHCLLASWQDVPANFKISSYQVKNINKRTALFGERFFVFPEANQVLLDFLISHKVAAAKSSADSLPAGNGYYVVGRQNIFDPKHANVYRNIESIFPTV